MLHLRMLPTYRENVEKIMLERSWKYPSIQKSLILYTDYLKHLLSGMMQYRRLAGERNVALEMLIDRKSQ